MGALAGRPSSSLSAARSCLTVATSRAAPVRSAAASCEQAVSAVPHSASWEPGMVRPDKNEVHTSQLAPVCAPLASGHSGTRRAQRWVSTPIFTSRPLPSRPGSCLRPASFHFRSMQLVRHSSPCCPSHGRMASSLLLTRAHRHSPPHCTIRSLFNSRSRAGLHQTPALLSLSAHAQPGGRSALHAPQLRRQRDKHAARLPPPPPPRYAARAAGEGSGCRCSWGGPGTGGWLAAAGCALSRTGRSPCPAQLGRNVIRKRSANWSSNT